MNNQNILKFFGSRLGIKLDSSEYYDYELSKTQGDYNTEVLDFSTPITYDSLKVDDSLENFSAVTLTIKLIEVDNTVNDPNYIYSGLSVVLDYNQFVSHFDTTGYTYSHIILNNHIYTYTGITGEIHYFSIYSYNEPTPIPTPEDNLIDAIITDNNEYISIGDVSYLKYIE